MRRSAAWAGALLLAGCALAGDGAPEAEALPPASRHAVHERELRTLMRRIEGLYRARLPTALDPREEQRLRSREVVEAARALAESAERIPEAGVGLAGADRERFRALADALGRRALALAEAAPVESPDQLRTRMRALDDTCTTCHERFRLPADGPRSQPPPD